MVKKIMTLSGFMLLFLASYGQVVISQLPINPARMSLDDLWGMTVINSEPDFKGYFTLDVKEENGFLIELVSDAVDIKNGTNTFGYGSLRYSINSVNTRNPEAQALSQSKFFSFGTYTICVRLIKQDFPDKYENCLEHEFVPLTPPMLVAPDYCSVPASITPLFVWVPPTPIIPGMELYYDLKIAEVFEGQSHQDAIDNNNPHYAVSGLTLNTFNYPISAAPFDTSKVYVWQVSARIKKYNGGENLEISDHYKGIGVSEVWCFHWRKKEVPPDILTTHIYTKTAIDGGFVNVGNTFFLAHKERSGKGQVSVTFITESGKTLNTRFTLDAKRGDNRYDLNLRAAGEFKHKDFYILQVTDSKGQVSKIKFQYWEQ